MSNNTDDNKITLKVKSTSSGGDFQIKANLNETVKELGARILSELDGIGKGIRLISAGKMLQPPTAKLNELNLLDGSYIHAVVSDINSTNYMTSSSSNNSTNTFTNTSPTIPIVIDRSNLRGLDRLLNDGLSIDEVAAVRSVFRQQIDAFAIIVPRMPEEDVISYQSRVEDRWMQVQSSHSEFSMNLPHRNRSVFLTPTTHATTTTGESDVTTMDGNAFTASLYRDYSTEEVTAQGTFSDFIWGCLMGSMLGFIMIFCVWDRNIPYRQKMGIMLGVTVHFVFSAIYPQRSRV